ncbi:MAG: AmmeMemoRadiSam system radical SAM enzyme [Vicinamibacteria bacterium]|nr:AmmeMemoRadiSam system radical SAM enzyme [Vicinamibacteria bacterium]
MTPGSLAEALDRRTRPATLCEPLAAGRVRCVACGHRCVVPPGQRGICKVRFNDGGTLRAPWGYAAGIAVDPVEKKPFFHLLPGARALSFGMLGCDLHCGYCQNWVTSQALRDPAAVSPPRDVSPADLVALALEHGAPIVTSTYNEPLITAEWAVDVFRPAREAGLLCSFVSNGNGTPEVLDFLAPWVSAYKVDLKSFRDRPYRDLGGTLQRVTETLEGLVARGIWVEVVTLIVPGFNDDEAELRDLVRFLAALSPDIPWHATAFHSDYKMDTTPDTGTRQLLRAVELGREAGLRFVYAGNRPGRVGGLEDTRCPGCDALLVERVGFVVRRNRLEHGTCPDCARAIPGVWQAPPPGRLQTAA